MPVATLTPVAVGNYDAWTLGAGGSKVIAVDPPDDDDTTYISNITDNNRQSFTVDQLSGAASIQTHAVKGRVRSESGTPNFALFIRRSGVDTDGTGTAPTTSYVDYTATDLGGGTPTPDEVNATEIGIRDTSGANVLRCTTLKWEVTYTPSGGGFAAFAAVFLAGLLGAGIILTEATRIADEIYRRSSGNLRITPAEYARLYHEIKSDPHRVYLFRGV